MQEKLQCAGQTTRLIAQWDDWKGDFNLKTSIHQECVDLTYLKWMNSDGDSYSNWNWDSRKLAGLKLQILQKVNLCHWNKETEMFIWKENHTLLVQCKQKSNKIYNICKHHNLTYKIKFKKQLFLNLLVCYLSFYFWEMVLINPHKAQHV